MSRECERAALGHGEDEAILDRTAAALAAGELVVLPTDTVYGLAALAADEDAVARVYAAKGRAPDKKLPLLIADPHEIVLLTADLPGYASELAARYWPGALTLVVRGSADISPWLLDERGTVALRCPDHRFTRRLARLVGPLAATSANLSGEADASVIGDVDPALIEVVDLAVDGGPTGGTASTVVDCTGERPVVLRQGAVRLPDARTGA